MEISFTEKELQSRVHQIISEPSKVFKTKSGKRLQILSPGRHNSSEGPDFLEIAVLLNGFLIVGDCEFHINASDWISHKHENNDNYKNVILHIVINDDKDINGKFETLVLDNVIDELTKLKSIKITEDILSNIEELQNFALVRLLRKTSEAKKTRLNYSLADSLAIMSQRFISRYEQRRRRPQYNAEKLSKLIDCINSSAIFQFLQNLENGEIITIPDMMQNLLKTKISDEGPHLRRELILNAVLPLALAVANEESRVNLFVWYWSTPALNKYRILQDRFPDNPQHFLWQQQGMLEFLKEYGKKENIVAESIKEYGFLEVLSFYRVGRLPLEFFEFNE